MSTRATPLAFGMWQFALPGTDALWLHWDGPGTGLYLACAKAMRPIEHASASGVFPNRRQAQLAAERFIAQCRADLGNLVTQTTARTSEGLPRATR